MRYESGSATAGVALALAAYVIWGVAPIYWKALDSLPAGELLAQRVVWSCVVGIALVSLTRGWKRLLAVARRPRRAGPMLLAALLIGGNWLTFVWAVLHDQIVATSLGYYITPLVNVALGVAVLKERLRPLQTAAVGLAGLGILQFALSLGALPWITLVLAFSFAGYGLVRKLAPVGPIVGFGLETQALVPLAAVYLALLARDGAATFPTGRGDVDLLVVGAGAFTAAPLLCFNAAAKRLRLVTLGFFQYIAPSISLVIAVALFDEPFGVRAGLAFACVWLALGLYSVDSLRGVR